MTPEEQWLKLFDDIPLQSSEQQRTLAELRTSYHHLIERLIAVLPPGHTKTHALTNLQQSYLWASAAIEVYTPKAKEGEKPWIRSLHSP